WTITLTAKEVMYKLQATGVPAGVAQKSEELYNDPQLKHRGYFWEVDHPVIGKHLLESQAFQLSKSPRRLRMPAPRMGGGKGIVVTLPHCYSSVNLIIHDDRREEMKP
ncbi:unnamed protein product, partial [marine sediment metagenome]